MSTPERQTDQTRPRPLHGTEVRLRGFGYEAEVATVGAALRALRFEGRDLVIPSPQGEVHPYYSGVILAPWPNRVIDAHYTWDGQERRLDISEPDRGHALHGLATWHDFDVVESSQQEATLRAGIGPQAGYPHRVEVVVGYAVTPQGLGVTVSATLTGGAPAPFGWGSHPYLVAPGERVDEWTLTLPARTVQHVDQPRLVPTGSAPVHGTDLDFRSPRRIGDAAIDHAFTDLDRDATGLVSVRVTDAAGDGAAMTWDQAGAWVQVHTADLPSDPQHHRAGLAVEPMSCPPGAFNSGTDVLRLEPGETVSGSWTISALVGR